MARERERRGRAVERERAERQARLIYIGVGTVLGLAALLIAAGLYVTQYRPPRAHVVTVGDHSYQVRDVVDRGVYLAFFEGGIASAAEIASGTVSAILEEEALRRLGPETVEVVTAADIEREIQIRLGLIADEPDPVPDAVDATAEPSSTAEPSATAEPTTTVEPTPEPTVDVQEFADALTAFLRDTGLERAEYEAIVEAGLYRDRLRALFTAEVGESGPQIRLERISVSTQLAADSVIEELEGGADFATLAEEQSVAAEDGAGPDVGWTVARLESADVRAAIEGLAVGEWTQIIITEQFFDIYRLAETAEDRVYEDGLDLRLVDDRLGTWMEDAIASLEVKSDLSTDEETWINEHVLSDVTSRLGG